MPRLDILGKERKIDINNYIDTWQRVTIDDDPLLKRWKQHVDSTTKKCSNKK